MAMLSSPLAAMQPPPRPAASWGYGRDIPEQRSRVANNGSFGRTSGFNFKDLSMSRPHQDYFGGTKVAPVRGSSPTASLAADLSQNFYIDQSPKLPTPRRSLFTSGVFAGSGQVEGATTPPCRWEGVTTPPIPSSSPYCGADAMDISPLPHKIPFSFTQASKLESPSRNSASNVDMISPCSPAPPNPLMELRGPVLERKKSNLNRPSLARSKCLSTSTIVTRAKENLLPQFTFGAGNKSLDNAPSTTTTMSLDECFSESPRQDRNLFGNAMGCLPRPRLLYGQANNQNRGSGSPFSGPPRKPTVPAARPRKQFRRSLSMFEHPADVMKADKEEEPRAALDSIMDADEGHQLRLPNFIPEDKPDSLPRVNQETMIAVLNGEYKHIYEQTLVIDCRFEYEYNGGHIDGARNFNDKEHLSRSLFDSATINENTLIILHCEYSAHRAPLMAQYIRQQDRSYNVAQYPKLTYPELYILDGGYSNFFKTHRLRCYPQNYVEMDAKEHEVACERGLNKMRQRTKLSRARTFAFGQQLFKDEDTSNPMSDTDNCYGIDLSQNRMHARRMASY